MYIYILILFGALVQAHPQQFHNDLIVNQNRCSVTISSLTEPQPSLVINGKLIAPVGNSESFQFSASDKIIASCFGKNNGLSQNSTDEHPTTATLMCKSDTLFTSTEWLKETTQLGEVKCISHSTWLERKEESCAHGQGFNVAVGVQAMTPKQIDIYKSCFDQINAAVLYVTYSQTPESIKSQKSDRPEFKQGEWYPNLSVNSLYTQKVQKTNIALVVGDAMADVYYRDTYLARGHLAAKTDFVLSTEQRATFSYINCVPQWQSFNGGNWNTLEDNLRKRISVGNFRTTIYTGSWGVLQLKDSSNELHDIYLSPRVKQLPAPLWLFKVVHDASTNKATAFLGLNNPFVTLQEAKDLTFCENKCFGDSNFNWLNWKAENTTLGFGICCDVNDFRKVVNYLPEFEVNGLFY